MRNRTPQESSASNNLLRMVVGCLCVAVFAVSATAQSEPGAQATGRTVAAGVPAGRADDSNPRSAIPNPQSAIPNPQSDDPQSTQPAEFDLEAFIAGLNPPTLEEIFASLEPIPTLEEVLAALDEPAPPRPELPQEVVARVKELEERIDELRNVGFAGDDKPAQDAALAEAIELAEQVLAIRQEHQSGCTNGAGEPAEWYEVGDARRAVADLRLRTSLSPKQRAELEDAHAKGSEAEGLQSQGKHDQALELVGEQLKVRCRLLSDEHPDVALSLNNLAGLLWAQGEHAAAEPLLREALALHRKLLADEHPDVATSLNNLAILLQATGDYAAAEPLHREALAMRRKLLGDEHPNVANSLANLATLLVDKGDYAVAEPLMRQALALCRKLLGNEHPEVANGLNNLAELLRAKGDYAAAEPLFREAIAMWRKLLGDEHPLVATSLNNLALLLQAKGDYAAAEPLFREAFAMRRRLLGDEHPDVAESLNNLALLLHNKGDYVAAEPLHREALTTKRRLLGNEHPRVAISLNNLALLLHAKRDYAAAEPLHGEALTMRRKLLGDEHPDVALSLYNLALLLQAKGDYAAAEPLYREAFAMWRKLLGDEHPRVALSLKNLARLLHAKGDYAAAEPLLAEAADVFEKARLRISTRGGLERAGALRTPLPRLASVQVRLGRHSDAWRRLEAHFARGLLDEIALRQARPLTPAERNREDSLIGRWSKLDERISSLLAKPASVDRDALLGKLKRERETLQAELVYFAGAMRDKYGPAAGDVYELMQIQHSLPSDAALVAWLDLPGSPHAVNPHGEHRACVVRKTGEPIWVELRGSGADGAWTEDDDRLPSKVRKALSNRQSDGRERESEIATLYAQRIAPIEPHLTGSIGVSPVTHLIVLPAGWMGGVPVEALTDRYIISYAPSGTMYAWLREQSDEAAERRSDEGSPTLLALGDPVFAQPEESEQPKAAPPDHGVFLAMVQPGSNADQHGLQRGDVLLRYDGRKLEQAADLGPAIQALAAKKEEVSIEVWREGKTLELSLASGRMGVRSQERPAAEAVLALRRMDDVLDRTRGDAFAALPATRKEVQTISELFGKRATVLLGSVASEQRLAEYAESGRLNDFRYLHFATHGMLDDERAMNSALILAQNNLPDPFEQVLAGKEPFDGRLTAEQVVRTWKLDAELVTLSGCQTALGKQAGGEGFLGFSQALFVAGARSLVLSLWKVDDKATALLMTRFYENLLGTRGDKPMAKAVALREAKLWLRSLSAADVRRLLNIETDAEWDKLLSGIRGIKDVTETVEETTPSVLAETRPFEHPFYWGAFILIGDPD